MRTPSPPTTPRPPVGAQSWNKVWLQYCDGTSQTSNNETVTWTTFNGTTVPLYFRGLRVWQAMVQRLIADYGLGAATDLVVSGDSAGGLSTYYHADRFAQALPSTRVVAAPDSGYFFDAGWAPWSDELRWVMTQGNGTAGLNAGCVAAKLAAGYDPLACAFPDVSTSYITTSLFVMNSRFDPALDSIVAGEDGKNVTRVQAIGDQLLAWVQLTALQGRPGNAAFLTSCHQHCGQWAQGQVGGDGVPGDFNVTIDGDTAPAAFDAWFGGRAGGKQLWLQAAPYPCATCCEGGQA